ncbi:RNA-binding domain-containing protein [Violaceomyces palustris]|uniref:RNA-binding domain-containing protein n=1 Tax=Violaceomyces palustris TaxID=1673888 RepID=A0ACD0NQZ3_9BASI|nr:RNA-binding domain-containing protein [Violaceomyces palustris]
MTDSTPNSTPVINGTNGVDQQKPSDDAQKVIAGNLAFATTEDELKELFSEAGKVTHAQIITRGTRSLGYGFVTFATEAEAQKAVELLDKKEIAGRQINVESAKPQAANEDAERSAGTKGRGRGRPARGRGRGGARASRRPRTDEGEEGGAESTPAAAESEKEGADAKPNGPSKSARRRQKKSAAKKEASEAAAAAAADPESGVPAATGAESTDSKKPKAKRQPKGAPTGEPSKTLVFVANLPFDATDEKLKEAFSEYKIKSAHVVKRRAGNRSKGFGFIDFQDEAEQKKAVELSQGKELDGRPLSLKVAIQEDKEKKEETEKTAAATEG